MGFIRIYGTVEADKNTHKLSPFHLSFPCVMVSSISQCNDRTINMLWTGHGREDQAAGKGGQGAGEGGRVQGGRGKRPGSRGKQSDREQ